MSGTARRHRATAADLAAPPRRPGGRGDRRELVEKAAPSDQHGDAQASLAELLEPPFQRGRGGPGGWWIATEVEVELETHEVYRPDLVGWRRSASPSAPTGDPVRERPDWVSEVLSLSDAETDLGRKLFAYHRTGIPHDWIVEPEHETLTVHGWSEGGYLVVLTAGRRDTVRAPPFEDVEIAIGQLFGA